MIERLLVALIVIAAAAYAVWALMPGGVRKGWALGLARSLGGSRSPGTRGRIAAALERAAAQPAGGCGSCPAATGNRTDTRDES